MSNLSSFKKRSSFFIIPLLAFCLLVSQIGFAAAPSCGVELGQDLGWVPKQRLKIMAFNLENFFTREAAEERGDVKELLKTDHQFKPEADIVREREIIIEQDPDIIVGSEMHLEGDAREFMDDPRLKDKYQQFLTVGNDKRGINIVMYLRKSLNFETKYITNKDVKWTNPITKETGPVFSRDLPVLVLTRPGEKKPAMIVIGNHAKSKRPSPGDPESTIERTAQYEAAKKIIENLRQEYGEKVPIVMAGDFNTDTINGPELSAIRNVVKSVFDSVKGKIFDLKDRITHFFFNRDGIRHGSQMDDIRVSGQINVIGAGVIGYEDNNGKIMPIPKSFKERQRQPSDHFPMVATVEI